MPTGVYKRSKEYKEKVSEKMRGNKFRLGKRSSQETRKKLSEFHKKHPIKYWLGKTFTEEHKNKIGLASLGRMASEQTRQKMSDWQIGSKSHRWKGGVSSINARIRGSYKFKIWRKAVLERDNYTCQFCNQQGGELEADHIISCSKIIEQIKFQFGIENLYESALRSELLWDISNGRVLCKECHKTTDTYQNKSRW